MAIELHKLKRRMKMNKKTNNLSRKTVKRKYTAVLLLGGLMAVSSLVKADNGGINSGGGSLEKATPQDVREAVKNIFSEKKMFGLFYFVQEQSRTNSNQELKNLFTKMSELENSKHRSDYGTGWTAAFLEDAFNTKFFFKKNGPCVNEGVARQATVASNTRSSPICFSEELITKEIPKAFLVESLIPLVMHELAHHFEANEILAKKVEALFSNWMLKNRNQIQAFRTIYIKIHRFLEVLEYRTSHPQKGDEIVTCTYLGVLWGKFSALEDSFRYIILNSSSPSYRKMEENLSKLSQDAINLSNYCGAKDNNSKMILNNKMHAFIRNFDNLSIELAPIVNWVPNSATIKKEQGADKLNQTIDEEADNSRSVQ